MTLDFVFFLGVIEGGKIKGPTFSPIEQRQTQQRLREPSRRFP